MKVIRIDFENTYELITVESNFSEATFNSIDVNNKQVLLKIMIIPLNYPLLPGVYNLSFGPPNADGTINDNIRINHQDPDKMFSTILLFALVFIKRKNKSTIGLDGSNDVRAYMYHRMFLTNFKYLAKFLVAFGVDWFVRLLRDGNMEKNVHGELFFKPRPEAFDYQRSSNDLFRYYMFQLINTEK
jgi:hypothetical protein